MKLKQIIEIIETQKKVNDESETHGKYGEGMKAGATMTYEIILDMLYNCEDNQIGQEDAMTQGLPY